MLLAIIAYIKKFALANGLVIFLAFCILSCGNSTNYDLPLANDFDSTLVKNTSTLYVPISFDLNNLTKLVNTKLDGTFLSKDILIEDRKAEIFLEVTKTDNINLYWDTPVLTYTAPLKISALFKKDLLGLTIKNQKPIETELILHMKSEIDFDQSWKLSPTTTLDSIQWIKEPTLPVGFFELNLKNQLEKFLIENQDTLLYQLDATLGSLIKLDEAITKIWVDIQKPILINRQAQEVWLKLDAQDIRLKLLKEPKNEIRALARLNTFVYADINREKLENLPNRLPRYRKLSFSEDSLKIFIHSNLDLNEINEIINYNLKGQQLSYSGYTVNIDSVRLYGNKEKVIVLSWIAGDVEALIEVEGKPMYIQDKKQIAIDSFNYKIHTNNTLLGITNNLLYEYVMNHVVSYLSIEISEEISRLSDIINQAISNSNIGDKVEILFHNLDIDLSDFLISKNFLQFTIYAEGRAEINIKKEAIRPRAHEKVNP